MKKRFQFIVLLSLIIGIAIGGVYYFKPSLRAPEFISIEKIDYIETNGTDLLFNARAKFYNPNNFEAQILNSELKVISKDIEVARISQSNISKIDANSTFNVEFKFNINVAQLSLSHGLSGVLANLLSDVKEIPVHFSGYTRVKSRGEVYKIPIEYDQILKFK
jgi:LEA14-like dessication related protein